VILKRNGIAGEHLPRPAATMVAKHRGLSIERKFVTAHIAVLQSPIALDGVPMKHQIPTYIGNDAISRLMAYCAERSLQEFALVADHNTYPALGEALERALKADGCDVHLILLTGDEVIADEYYIAKVVLAADARERVYLAVGSGTITDIVRFVSHRCRLPFIAVPTAPSVDGFTSIGAPLVVDRIKLTLITQPPIAVFADLPTLCAAPHRMIASGFGDMLGKFTSLADWQLGHLLWDEDYSPEIARRARQAVQLCTDHASEIGQADEAGVRPLIEGLIESGLCMLDFGKTTPASGSEHHLSHYWEMRLLWEDRPSLLHGAKVGVASVLIARLYDRIKHISAAQAADLMDNTPQPSPVDEVNAIRAAWGPIADAVIEEQRPFLDLDGRAYERLKQCVVDHWADIQDLAAGVPDADRMTELLHTVGAPTEPAMLGLSDDDVARALCCAHYFRNRFSVVKLSRMLGLA
jgi:glycerol-1-phosphate dehydrogenase [NAD(P)+]